MNESALCLGAARETPGTVTRTTTGDDPAGRNAFAKMTVPGERKWG